MSADECEEADTAVNKEDHLHEDGEDNQGRHVSDDGNEELEDGELEDGEIDDDPVEFGGNKFNDSAENLGENQHESKKSSKKDKRKRKRSKREKSQEGERKRSKKKRHGDHGHNDDENDVNWTDEQHHRNRRPKYLDRDSPSADLYDSPYDSPPGLYDSPSDGEGDERGPTTMLGLVQDEFMDVNVAAHEKQTGDIEKSNKRQSKKKYKPKPPENRPQKHAARKTPLNELPRSERPLCKFFKEGKCQKGSTCPFNHDFQPEKRNDVCKFYLTSGCNRDNCLFMHSEFPCKYFHAGKGCYAGDDCKFSHDPLTEETQICFDRVMEEEMMQKKPSLLGSPPQHVIDEAERLKERIEQVKKIPSIFDIETFPPGHSPRKPSPQKNVSPIRPPGPGFFVDTSGSGTPVLPQGPPPMNNQGPPGAPPVNNMGPGMNNLGPPMVNLGPPVNNLGPPMNNMGPMNNMRPQMNMPPRFPGGPGPEMNQGPANQGSSVLNMIGAILRTAAPLIVNQRSGLSQNNSLVGQTDNGHSMTENDQSYPSDGNSSHGQFYGSVGGEMDNSNIKNNVSDISTERTSSIQEDKDPRGTQSKSYLDPRSARAQLEARPLETEPPLVSNTLVGLDSDHHRSNMEVNENNAAKKQNDNQPPPRPDMDFGPKFEFSSLKDDNWYSSDEEEETNKSQPVASNSAPSSTKTSTINIMEMISNARTSSSISSESKSTEATRPSYYSPSMTLSQTYNVKPPAEDNVPVTHCVLKNMLYRIKTFTFLSLDKPYDNLPGDVNPIDSRYQSDPRVQKYSQRLARKTLMQPKKLEPEKKVERVHLPDLNLSSDGNLILPESKPRPLDPRMSRNLSSGSDDSGSRHDPRSVGHDPRSQKSHDPRPLNQDPRSHNQDPRSVNKDPRSQNKDPRSHQDPRSHHQDPRSQHQDPRSQHQDTRLFHDQRSQNFDPRQSFDPRSQNLDLRAHQQDPRSQNLDPRSQQQDPRSQNLDPRSQQQDPRSQNLDPRSQQHDPRSQNLDPRSQMKDPRALHLDPRSQRHDPRMRRSQDSNEGTLTLKLKNMLSDPGEIQKSGIQRADPRVSRSMSLEGGVQGSVEKSKLTGLSDFPSLLNRPNQDQYS